MNPNTNNSRTSSRPFVVLLLLLLTFNLHAQLIKDNNTLTDMQRMLQKEQSLTSGRSHQLFDVYKLNLTADERQALDYLYAYMPLSDLADYTGEFFLQQIQSQLKARMEMPWGMQVPEDVFLHFVLPLRVNNENLDQFRTVMYDEIKARVAGMNMRDAALEVNHWCHEKVTYRGSDERTSSPLATIKTSFGRCGEESTLTVTALRTIGIPARQVYTPRWAHTDDNHAWVEVWVDGKWYFLGACEPEPALNMGWFSEPARRAMLVHTRAYGAYHGTGPIIDKQERFTELNLIQNYATAKNIYVKVVSENNLPVTGAKVEYQLYNYAEFYPIAKGLTDNQGMCSIITGLGDLLIWAYKGNSWGYKKISVDKMDSITVMIHDKHPENLTETFDLIPPVEKTPLQTELSKKDNDLNSIRLHNEDSLRMLYMATFKDSVWVSAFAKSQGLSPEKLLPIFRKSYGNWKEISDFITAAPAFQKEWAVLLLESVSDKDLRDAKAETLKDHLSNSFNYNNPLSNTDKEFFARNVMSGRIANEMMLPWRAFLQKQFKYDFVMQFKSDPGILIDWIKTNIQLDDTTNLHSRAPLSPQGVFELKRADRRSRDIFFVAVCRSLGHAARINPATGIPQDYDGHEWHNIVFEAEKASLKNKGFVHFINTNSLFDPKYTVNFTIAHFSDGVYRTIDFDEGQKLSEFDTKTEVEAGKYMLVTGNRLGDGSVLSSITFFEVPTSGIADVKVEIRKDFQPIVPIGNIDPANYSLNLISNNTSVALKTLAHVHGCLLVWIDPDKEPSKHVMADIPAVKDLIEKWGGEVAFIIANEKSAAAFNPSKFHNLPSKSIFALDKQDKLLTGLNVARQRNDKNSFPVIALLNDVGELLYYSEGYKIGIGEQIAKVISILK